MDGGSSENFVQPRIVQCLKLPVEPVPSFRVLIGNGQYMQTEGWIEKLSVQVQGNELTLPVYVLPVVGADLILGSSWLATLGPHVADYATAVLKFFYENKFVVLKGDRKEQPTEAQLHQLKSKRCLLTVAKQHDQLTENHMPLRKQLFYKLEEIILTHCKYHLETVE